LEGIWEKKQREQDVIFSAQCYYFNQE
jgi:hypothetical protein